ncbi:MAG: J domain-containing protein [Gammaproteobacteria bacterium]
MNAAQKDLYRILGVLDSAELVVIRAAYKALMMTYHPDRYNGAKENAIRKSKEINEAYAVLTDLEKRKKYDTERLKKPMNKSNKPEIELNHMRNDLRGILIESEAILKILNETD